MKKRLNVELRHKSGRLFHAAESSPKAIDQNDESPPHKADHTKFSFKQGRGERMLGVYSKAVKTFRKILFSRLTGIAFSFLTEKNPENGKITIILQKNSETIKFLRFLQKNSTFFVKYIDKWLFMRYN